MWGFWGLFYQASFSMHIEHFHTSFCEVSFKPFAHLSDACLLTLEELEPFLKKYLYTRHLSDMCVMTIFSQSVACLFNFLMEFLFFLFLKMQMLLRIVNI